MSVRGIMQRFAYIDSRLRYRKDYPSARALADGLREQYGETPDVQTIQRDIEKLRGAGLRSSTMRGGTGTPTPMRTGSCRGSF